MNRIPLYYTFGNHMHWVDMQWLWGYAVLPDSIQDMIHFCRETGAKGNVNFEGVGYEKLAAENPEALSALREAVGSGSIEPVGCSYGQPYGLFHGGESNIRQRVYGSRAVRRLLGVWPKTFWEEEFDFFPQLPQMLKGCGFEYASLFFQWTWHTPEIPKEEAPVVWWEGQDGSRLLCATRNKLNLHQWPEDMDATFAELAAAPPVQGEGPTPLILQWLELMPSPDWMCRSEVLLPKMRELLSDERFEIKMATLGEYLRGVSGSEIPVRHYTMDEVWHGMSLGKNGDFMRRESFETESTLLAAETLSAINGILGRPYAQWDVYPTWELEEQWRNLLMAQHHDNDECEGLCGHVGKAQYRTAAEESQRILDTQIDRTTDDFMEEGDNTWIFNPLGWERDWHVVHREGAMTVSKIPAFGWNLVPTTAPDVTLGGWEVVGRVARYRRGQVAVDVDLDRATITHLANSAFPEGTPLENGTLWTWCGKSRDGADFRVRGHSQPPQILSERWIRFTVEFQDRDEVFSVLLGCEPHTGGVAVRLEGDVPPTSPGLNSAFGMKLGLPAEFSHIQSDEPYGVSTKHPCGKFHKKYPTGDWMTSPQWFEEIERPFSSHCFADFSDVESETGLLMAHNGSRQWIQEADGTIRHVVHAYDPWDEKREVGELENRFFLLPHGATSKSSLWKQAQEAMRNCWELGVGSAKPNMPSSYSAVSCDASNVAPTAFFRETEDFSGKYLDDYAGKGMAYPYVVRLVEFDGVETTAKLSVAGTVAKAYKTNMLGQVMEDITDSMTIPLGPYEIATVYLDIMEGRKQTRDLDAKREIWATVHRVEE